MSHLANCILLAQLIATLEFLGLIATPNSPNGKYNLPPASPASSTHPTPFPPAHPLIHAICDITVVVKKVAQNPAVLASYYR